MGVSDETEKQPPDWAWAEIRKALGRLRYGQVVVIVQDGVIIQVERTERFRIARRPGKRAATQDE